MIDANENGYCGLDQVPTRQEWDPQKVYALIVALPSFVWMSKRELKEKHLSSEGIDVIIERREDIRMSVICLSLWCCWSWGLWWTTPFTGLRTGTTHGGREVWWQRHNGDPGKNYFVMKTVIVQLTHPRIFSSSPQLELCTEYTSPHFTPCKYRTYHY